MHTWERTARLQSYAGSGSTQDKLMLYNQKLLLQWLQIWMWQIPALPFHMFQKAFPGKLKPALSGTHRYGFLVKKTAAAFILHLAIAEWLSYDISSCLLLWIDKDAQICRDITGALILWFFFLLNALVSGLQCILTGNMDFFLENHLIEHKNGSEVGVQFRGYE